MPAMTASPMAMAMTHFDPAIGTLALYFTGAGIDQHLVTTVLVAEAAEIQGKQHDTCR